MKSVKPARYSYSPPLCESVITPQRLRVISESDDTEELFASRLAADLQQPQTYTYSFITTTYFTLLPTGGATSFWRGIKMLK